MKITVAAATCAAALAVGTGVVVGSRLTAVPTTSAQPTTQLNVVKADSAASNVALKLLNEGVSAAMAKWASEPGCETPQVTFKASDFGGGAATVKAALQDMWTIVKSKCTADSAGFPDYLYSVPAGTLLRDPDKHAVWFTTKQGMKHVPTGGDYLCFVGQGAPVIQVAGLTGLIQGFSAGDAKCTPTAAPQAPQQAPVQQPVLQAPAQQAPVQADPPAQQPAQQQPAQQAPAQQQPAQQAPAQQPQPNPGPAYTETTGGETHTWSDRNSAGGTAGPVIASNTTLQITCRADGFRVSDGNATWYLVAPSPWSNQFWASADAFYNNGSTSGSLHGTPYYDPNVPTC